MLWKIHCILPTLSHGSLLGKFIWKALPPTNQNLLLDFINAEGERVLRKHSKNGRAKKEKAIIYKLYVTRALVLLSLENTSTFPSCSEWIHCLTGSFPLPGTAHICVWPTWDEWEQLGGVGLLQPSQA